MEGSGVPRVMNGAGVVTGSVLSFGGNTEEDDSEDEDADIFGMLGLGAGVSEALTARVIHGLTVGGNGEGGAEENSEGKEGKE